MAAEKSAINAAFAIGVSRKSFFDRLTVTSAITNSLKNEILKYMGLADPILSPLS
jgi:hypothetical protein